MSASQAAVEALDRGLAFVNLSSWWKVGVAGSDAGAWLNDLLSAELSGIAAGEARGSFLLTPTGRIRAAVTVTRYEDDYLLLQDPAQPTRIDRLLDPYVLSSDVVLGDRTAELSLSAFPNRDTSPIDGAAHRPSVLGQGIDVLTAAVITPTDVVEASLEDVERWRIRRGIARFAVDLGTDSLPHEADVAELIAYGKGCFLGQEAVARVRNLGRPPFVILAAHAPAGVSVDEPILAGDREAGRVTSATQDRSGTALIVRVRWGLKDAPLATPAGVELVIRGPASAA